MPDFVPNDWADGESFGSQHVDAIELELDEQEGMDLTQNLFLNMRPGGWTSGQYYFMNSANSVSTSAALGFASLRVAASYIPSSVAISRLAWDCSAAGDPAATFRPCVYADNGFGAPGALVVEGGDVTMAALGQFESTVSVTLPAGLYWCGGILRGTGTQPTLRTCNPGSLSGLLLPLGSTIPSTLTSGMFSYVKGSVAAGALPNPFGTATVSGTSAVRLALKVA